MGIALTRRGSIAARGYESDGVTAAATLGWGAPYYQTTDWSDVGDSDTAWLKSWVSPGNQWGVKLPEQVEVVNGMLRITGTAGTKTAGQVMFAGADEEWGSVGARYEFRSRVTQGDDKWAAVALLWPGDGGVWPDDGEVDFYEGPTGTSGGGGTVNVGFNLHYTNPGHQQIQDDISTNIREWNNFAVEWIPGSHVSGYRNGVRFFHTTNLTAVPSGQMWLSLQMDHHAETPASIPAIWEIAWVRQYLI
ncbi:MAG TPA: hypothetical protein PKE10_03350 [Candidatus Saccharibacteria bacterium]|nr:hypothetical protein [Candidatus Saccharibacteria bacterium]